MNFWHEVFASFLAGTFTAALVAYVYGAIQWFLRATDVKVGYGWKQQNKGFYPAFDIRNRSGSKTYYLANIEYKNNFGTNVVWYDNESIRGIELKPGTMNFVDGAAVPQINSLRQCLDMQVTLALQTGRRFWLRGMGPGQIQMNRTQRIVFGCVTG